MATLRLHLDRATVPLWDTDERQALINASQELADLRWEYDIVAGGCGAGDASLRMSPGTPAYETLVERGQAAVAWIWWVRDANEADAEDAETDLLWVGMAEDAEVDEDSGLVTIRLRGAGDWLEELRFTGSYEYEKITTIASDIFQAAITAGDSPITTKAIDTSGVLQRRVSVSWEDVSLRRALQELQDLAGGPSMVSFGVRPADDQDDYATGYFLNWEGHLYAKTAIATPRLVYSLTEQNLTKLRRRSTSQDVRNAIIVLGDEIPGSGTRDESPSVYRGEAEAGESIERFGRRELLIEERALKSHGACALYASGVAAARASLDREIECDALLSVRSEPSNAQLAENLLSTTLARSGRFLTVRTPVPPYIPWGDGRKLLRNRRETDGLYRNYSRIDLTGAPSGADAPLFDLNSALSPGDKRMYIILGQRPSITATSPGIIELDRGIAMRWTDTGSGNYALQMGYRNTSGNWIALSTTATRRTAAELANPHLVALGVEYSTALIHRFHAYHMDIANGGAAMGTDVMTVANISSTATPNLMYLNAAFSTGVDAFSTSAGTSDDYDIAWVAAVNDFPATGIDTWLEDFGVGEFPFKKMGDLVLFCNFAQIDPNDADASLVRYAYGQSSPASEYSHQLWSGHSNGYVEDTSIFSSWRSYDWLLGERRAPRKLGQNAEVIPATAKCYYGGAGMPIGIDIRGLKGSQRQTDFLLQALEAIERGADNARRTR